MSFSERLEVINKRIARALLKSPNPKRRVQLVGVSKGQSVNLIREAADCGVLDLGENYAQELLTKAPLCMDKGVRWHFIGKLQSNKIKHILPYVSSIDSVDSLELAQKIARLVQQLPSRNEKFPIMLQVNVGSERQKSGLPPGVILELFPEFLSIEEVSVVGLMCIPPAHKDLEKVRPYFQNMRKLHEEIRSKFPAAKEFQHLSMGMSQDFELAIEEGATCIRIGEALFGPRPHKEEV